MTQNVLTNHEAVTGSKHFFSFIFVIFERYVTNFRGTCVLVPISTHPTIHYTVRLRTESEANLLLLLNGNLTYMYFNVQ
jgi:hypothetical protein